MQNNETELTNTKGYVADGKQRLPSRLLGVVFLLLLLVTAVYYSIETLTPATWYYDQTTVMVGPHTIQATRADTDRKRVRGLSGRTHLADDEGMLFTFMDSVGTEPLYPVFWMKEMVMPIDIIWIAGEEIVAIDRLVQPEAPGTPDSDLQLYTPPVPVTAVLEVRGGWVEDRGIELGDVVVIE